MDVVVLAGGKCDPELAEFVGVEFRAEIPFHGRPMVEIVRDAVSDISDPIIVGGPQGLSQKQVEGGQSFIDSVRRGLESVTTDSFFLTTVDLPCLTKEAVADFIQRCDLKAALNYPIIDVNDCESEFPGMKRTTLKLKEGEFTGGNVAMMHTALMHQALPVLEQAYADRKSPVKLSKLVGLGTLARILISKLAPSTLGLQWLEGSVGKMLGVPVKAIRTPFAEIGADIDNLDQYKSLIALKK